MPNAMFSYSALHSKTAAMRARHLSAEQLAELSAKDTVADACTYLKNETVYSVIFAGYNERNLHRGDIELLLDGYLQSEVRKLYSFCNRQQRSILSYTYLRYEIEQLKNILRHILSGRPANIKYDTDSFFNGKLSIDLERLSQCTSIREFLQAVEGTPYHQILFPPLSQSNADLYVVEMHLDAYYFRHMWRIKDKMLGGNDKKIVSEAFGREIDMLNLMWIYRCKRYYNMEHEMIFPAIIPIHHKISKQWLQDIIATADLQSFLSMAEQTPYFALFDSLAERFIEQNYTAITANNMRRMIRRSPFSIACVTVYLHFMEQEISSIITTIEAIRYGVGKAINN